MRVPSRLIQFLAGCVIAASPAVVFADQPQPDLVKRGEYLARVGDCFSCHTKEGGPALAGGRQVETPFGTISSPNITPDKDTGIGNWSDDQFYRIMHDGLDDRGEYVYPVMPYDHYTKVTREDVLAIKAFLFSQPAVHAPQPPSHLSFPFNIRASLGVWRALFFKPGEFQPDPQASAEVNRGAYLVEGLGHCGACHTPRNILSGSEHSKQFAGGEISGQGWFAPNISSDIREGIGSWSDQQITDYLRSGVAPGKAVVAGPMAEVVHTSLQYLNDDDVHAMAAYLKATPAKESFTEKRLTDPPGAVAYLTHCASCHQQDGKGLGGAVPPLAGNGAVMAGGPQDVIRTILGGMPAQGSYGPMPGFSTSLTSGQIAEIANYVRSAWSNAAPATATVTMVDDLAKRTPTMISGTAGCAPIGPQQVADAISKDGVSGILDEITPSNMLTKIDEIVGKLKDPRLDAPQADVVNGLTAAYCAVVRTANGMPQQEQLRQLQRFAALLYSQLAGKPETSPTEHTGQPAPRQQQN